MKKTHLKYIFKCIKNDIARLISIFVIVMLGVGVLVGLTASPKDLQASLDTYYDKANLLDVYIQSTIGFDKSDEEFILQNVKGIEKIESYYQIDEYVNLNSTKVQGRLIYRDFNEEGIDSLELVEGNYPTTAEEVLMLNPKETMVDYSLGDFVTVNEKDYKIVGKVNDPFYVADQPENTIIGNGVLDGVIYFDNSFYDIKEITILKMTFKDAKKYNTFSDTYKNFINSKIDEISNLSAERLEVRKNSLREEISVQVEIAAVQALKEQIIGAMPSLEGSEFLDKIVDYIKGTSSFKEQVEAQIEQQFNKVINSMPLKWYVLSRNEVPSYYTVKVDIGKIDAIANILPVFFFLIALLVCISSVTRIVQNDRAQIGTLRSLGYSKGLIYVKYAVYGLLTTILGSVVGVTLGTFILPYVIMSIYQTLYSIPQFVFVFDYFASFLFSGLMIVMILGTISIIAFSCLKEHVNNLLTGKAPVAGKKIFLERIPFLWNHISFKMKSMFRNVFRFKKNLIMMLIGIGGCTAILLTSFGLQDSLAVIQTEQYTTLNKYDMIVSVENVEENPIKESFNNTPIYYLTGNVLDKDENIGVSIFGSNKLSEYITFTGENKFDTNSVVITKQIADTLKLEVGEMITVETNNRNDYCQMRVTDITQNYINNFIYIGEAAYNNYFKTEKMNAFLVYTGLEGQELKDYSRLLLENSNVLSISSTSDMKDVYGNVLNNLTSIVVILVLLSGALIAVVIYNLTDIIINERIKEIATLRVTGYTRRESLMYIFREIIFMSILGILIGLGVGVFFHRFVILNITSIGLSFGLTIQPLSYLYTMLLAIGFITITAVCFYPKIKKIQMAEALKSVE